MNKIIIDTTTLKAILDRHPQMEVELLAVAREKVAEELKRKLPDGYATKMADDMMTDFKRRINESCLGWRGGTLTDTVQKIIRDFVGETCVAQTKRMAEETAKAAAEKAIEVMLPKLEDRLLKHQDVVMKSINGLVVSEVNKQVNARLDAMTKLTAGLMP